MTLSCREFWTTLILLCCLAGCTTASDSPALILDTDIASDCDDAGAVALLNALNDRGEVRVVAMMVSTGGRYGAPALSSINAWYGHAVPIGMVDAPDFWVGGGPDRPAGWLNYESYNRVLAETRPGPLHAGEAPEATGLYRRLLAAAPDASVTLCSIGPLINLHRLLDSPADATSPLSGLELVRSKVAQLVVAGGRNPEGTSSNFGKQGAAVHTCAVVERWPSPIVFVGNDVGGEIPSGWRPGPEAGENPARLAYRRFHAGDAAKKRNSPDQAAVLFAVRGAGSWAEVVRGGRQTCDAQGRNRWDPAATGGAHAYLRKRAGVDQQLQEEIEELMNQPARMPAAPIGSAPGRMANDGK